MKLSLSVKFRGREYRSPRRGIEAYRAYVKEGFDKGVKEMKPDMRAYLEEVVNALVEKHSKSYPGGTTSDSLSKRSGRGIEAIRQGVKITGGRLDTLRARLKIPTPIAYHEYEHTKRAGGKLMTIPLPAALNPNGTPIKPSARAWENTFITTSRRGNLIIFQRRGRRIIPLYVLKDSVTVPARLGAGKMMQTKLPHFQERIADSIADAFN